MGSLKLLIVASAMAVACPSVAKPSDGSGVAQYELQIEQQSLSSALQEFAKQSGVQIIFFSKVTDGYEAPALKGKYAAADALQRLLDRSGLTFRELNDKTIEVQPKAAVNDLNAAQGASAATRLMEDQADRFRLAQSSDALPSGTGSEDRSGDQGGDDLGLEEIIVTAQKRKENLQDVPIAITVLGGEELDSSSFSNFTDALRTIPGFDSNREVGTGLTTISIRGVSNSRARGGGAGTGAYYIDGTPFGFARSSFVPGDGGLYDLERIEFLAGPQGTLYGANALNGVLRILTRDPNLDAFEFKARGSVSMTEGGGQNDSGDLALNVPIIDGRLALRAVVGYQDESGWVDAPDARDVNDSNSRNYRLKLGAQITDTLSTVLSAWRSETDAGGLNNADDRGRITALEDQPSEQEFTVYAAEIEQEFPSFSVSSVTSYMEFDGGGRLSAEPLGAPIGLDTFMTAEVFSQEINFVSNLDGPWRWSAGVFYRNAEDYTYQNLLFFDELQLGSGMIVGDAIQDDYTDTSESFAVYGELGRSFFDDALDFAVGLRYFHDDQALTLRSQYYSPPLLGSPFETTSGAVTPRVVATWKPDPDFTVYASYAQGFRSGWTQVPDVQVLFANFTPVEPDRLTNYEIGSKGSVMNGALSYTAAVFYIDWQDIQQNLTIRLPPPSPLSTGAGVNGESASGLGAEASLSAQPIEGLRLSGSVSWNDLKFDSNVISDNAVLFREGERTLLSPEYTIGGEAEYSWKMASDLVGRISWGGDYKSPQNTSQLGVASTSNSIFMQRARFSLESPQHWTASLYAENLANETSSPTPDEPLQWSPRFRPRTVGLMFDYHFK